MSKIEVDAVEPQSGTSLTLGASGDTITIPAGATLATSGATVTLPDGSVTTAKLAYDPNPFRNIIINGDMSIAQRGTSASSVSSGYNTIDRFSIIQANSSANWNESQSTDVPNSQGFSTSWKLLVSTGGAIASNQRTTIRQRFEGQNLQYLKKGTASAESVTASFWVKSSTTGTYICQLRDINNSRSISKSYTINSANTWEKKTITYAGDTTGTLTNNNGASLDIWWWLDAGTNYSSGTLQTSWETLTDADSAVGQTNLGATTNNDFYITGVQLEAGTTASDFEFLPYDVNLQRCQRYFIKYVAPVNTGAGVTSSNGVATGTATIDSFIALPVTMRVSSSSMSLTANTLQTLIFATSVFHSGGTFSISYNTNNNNIPIRYTHGSGVFTLGQTVAIVGNGTTGFLTLSAEL
jgi:hypothetical protein